MKINPFVSAGICMSLLAACNPSSENKIQVAGQASMTIVPDMVELSLKAYSVKPAMRDAVAETQADIKEILTVCHKYIKNEEDIKVSNVATDKDFDYNGNRPVFNGYSARQILEVRLRNIRQLEAFTEELLATKINSIGNVRYNHSKADSLLRVVNLMALSDAKLTAVKMCDQMQVTLGKTIYLSNYPPNGGPTRGMQVSGSDYELNLYNKSFGGRGFKMTSEILEFQAVAFAGFEIRN